MTLRRARSWRWFRARILGLVATPNDWVVGGSKAHPIFRTRLQKAMHPDD